MKLWENSPVEKQRVPPQADSRRLESTQHLEPQAEARPRRAYAAGKQGDGTTPSPREARKAAVSKRRLIGSQEPILTNATRERRIWSRRQKRALVARMPQANNATPKRTQRVPPQADSRRLESTQHLEPQAEARPRRAYAAGKQGDGPKPSSREARKAAVSKRRVIGSKEPSRPTGRQNASIPKPRRRFLCRKAFRATRGQPSRDRDGFGASRRKTPRLSQGKRPRPRSKSVRLDKTTGKPILKSEHSTRAQLIRIRQFAVEQNVCADQWLLGLSIPRHRI